MKRLPIDLQSFVEIRTRDMAYVDKTGMVYDLTHSNKYFFLSRPRRFGKSVLCDTLRCYFEGRRELFEGLKIAELEKDWTVHPVIRLDMSGMTGKADAFQSKLDSMFSRYEDEYAVHPKPSASFAVRFEDIIRAAYQRNKVQAVVLIDEYDRPLQQSWGTKEHEEIKSVYRSVLEQLKPLGDYLRFVFLTGIVKFTQFSLFSSINNLNNISFEGRYATLCGITEEELHYYYDEHVQALADANGIDKEEAYRQLKQNYDGYYFSRRNMTNVYNPFSLLNALTKQELSNFWASSGASTLLTKFVPDLEADINSYNDSYRIDRDTLETSDITSTEYGLFLYQSGYLTIKDSNDYSYTLGFPNAEVRNALYKMVLPSVITRQASDVRRTQLYLADALEAGSVEDVFAQLKAQVADVPYSNIRYAERIMHVEERYRMVITIILRALGFRVEVERMQAVGRPDIVVYVKDKVYVLELKLENNGGAHAAAQQIRDRHYLDPFTSSEVFALGIGMDDEGKGLASYEQV